MTIRPCSQCKHFKPEQVACEHPILGGCLATGRSYSENAYRMRVGTAHCGTEARWFEPKTAEPDSTPLPRTLWEGLCGLFTRKDNP